MKVTGATVATLVGTCVVLSMCAGGIKLPDKPKTETQTTKTPIPDTTCEEPDDDVALATQDDDGYCYYPYNRNEFLSILRDFAGTSSIEMGDASEYYIGVKYVNTEKGLQAYRFIVDGKDVYECREVEANGEKYYVETSDDLIDEYGSNYIFNGTADESGTTSTRKTNRDELFQELLQWEEFASAFESSGDSVDNFDENAQYTREFTKILDSDGNVLTYRIEYKIGDKVIYGYTPEEGSYGMYHGDQKVYQIQQ